MVVGFQIKPILTNLDGFRSESSTIRFGSPNYLSLVCIHCTLYFTAINNWLFWSSKWRGDLPPSILIYFTLANIFFLTGPQFDYHLDWFPSVFVFFFFLWSVLLLLNLYQTREKQLREKGWNLDRYTKVNINCWDGKAKMTSFINSL